MTRLDEHGQPIGDPVDWSPRQPPSRVPLPGRYVVLEPITDCHTEALHDALGGPDAADLWTYRLDEPPVDLEDMRRKVALLAEADPSQAVTFAIVPREGRAEGHLTLMRIDPAHGSIEVGGVIYSHALQRTREATEAIALLMGHVFDDLGYRRFEWKRDSHNLPSDAAARRLGFTYEGRFRQAMVYKGRNRDTDWHAMTDGDWRRLRPAYDAWLAPANFDADGRQLTPLGTPRG